MAVNETEILNPSGTDPCAYQFGRFCLQVGEAGTMSLVSDGHAVGLTTGELTILRVLIENRGQFVKTRVLLDSVTQSSRASENIVHGAVRELRRTLHDAELIKTERTKGYRFTGDAVVRSREIAGDVTIAEARITEHEPATSAQTALPDRRRDTFLVVASLVSAAVPLLPFGLAFAAGSWRNVT